MDVSRKIAIVKDVIAEIITEEELENLFETNEHPTAYDGFEPSGIAHLPIGVFRPIILEKLMTTGIKFKLLLADTFAWINNKLGGDLEKIRDAGRYFVEVWKAAGVDMSKVEIIWHKDIFDDPEYWKKVLIIAKNTTMTRTKRALTVAGRLDSKNNPTSFLYYPIMQCADVFQLDVDICQLGIDQRKVNMLAREVSKSFTKKPIALHHALLLGLRKVKEARGFDENRAIDEMISFKMSKSIPESCIFVHDSYNVIQKKIRKAWCPEKILENNPLIDITQKIIFNKFDSIEIKTRTDSLSFGSYNEFKNSYLAGEIHPGDLKDFITEQLESLIKPIREHFEKNKNAKLLYERMKDVDITR